MVLNFRKIAEMIVIEGITRVEEFERLSIEVKRDLLKKWIIKTQKEIENQNWRSLLNRNL